MDNALTIAPRSIQEAEALSLSLAKSALLPEAMRGKAADILVAIMTGAELGFAPMMSLRAIVVIKGRPTLSADALGAMCMRRPEVCEYLTLVESSPAIATYATKRKGAKKETTLAFTIGDAQTAGLAGSDTYRKFPAAMLRARALSAICRAVYPDICLGLYDADELTDHPAPPPSAPRVERDVTPALEAVAPVRGPSPVVDAIAPTHEQLHQRPLENPVSIPTTYPSDALVAELVSLGATAEGIAARLGHAPGSDGKDAAQLKRWIVATKKKRDAMPKPDLEEAARLEVQKQAEESLAQADAKRAAAIPDGLLRDGPEQWHPDTRPRDYPKPAEKVPATKEQREEAFQFYVAFIKAATAAAQLAVKKLEWMEDWRLTDQDRKALGRSSGTKYEQLMADAVLVVEDRKRRANMQIDDKTSDVPL